MRTITIAGQQRTDMRTPTVPWRRRGTGVLCLVALLGALAGCPDGKKKPQNGDTLTIQMEVEPPHLVPMLQPDFWSKRITSHNVYESLVRLDPRTYAPQGELASTFDVARDNRTYRFFLRKGVRWHDGKPFGGADVKATLEALFDEKVRAAAARGEVGSLIESWKMAADDQLEVVLKKPSPFFLVALANLEILPAHHVKGVDLNTAPLLRRPVGTGPYRFVNWEAGQRVVLERWDGYWGEKPRIRRLVYRLVGSPDLALKLAIRRELDFVPRVRPAHWTGVVLKNQILRHEFVRTRHFPPGITYVMLNHGRPMFADRRVRLALAMLLDMDTVVNKIMHGIGKRVGSLYWFKDPHYNDAIEPYPYDPAGARKLLAEAGWTDSDGNGVLDREGEPLRFTFLRVTASKTQEKWLTIYQQALRKAGVVMEISPIDWAAYLEKLRAHDFDAGSLGMRFSGPQSDLYEQLHSSQMKDGQNFSSYSNAEADRLMEAIRHETDEKKHKALDLELQRLLHRDVALIPLFAEEEPGLVARRVHGVYTSALWYQVRDWWIE